MGQLEELAARVQALEDIEAIKRVKYRYWRYLDEKRWDELADCFTPDATASYGAGQYAFTGRDAIMQFLRDALGVGSGLRGVHHGHHPEIELEGPTRARGSWGLYNYMFHVERNRCLREAAYYADRYVKVDGTWKIAHTGYTYLFHEEWTRDDLPSLRLTAS